MFKLSPNLLLKSKQPGARVYLRPVKNVWKERLICWSKGRRVKIGMTLVLRYGGGGRGGWYLPQVWVPTVNRTPKAVAVKAETEER